MSWAFFGAGLIVGYIVGRRHARARAENAAREIIRMAHREERS